MMLMMKIRKTLRHLVGWYKLMLAQIATGPYVVRAEVVLIVTVSLMRVVRVQLGVKVGLEDVGMVGGTDEAEKVKAEVATRQEVEVEVDGVDYD